MNGIFIGFLTCMICDVVFSITNYFVQRAFYWREQRKSIRLYYGLPLQGKITYFRQENK